MRVCISVVCWQETAPLMLWYSSASGKHLIPWESFENRLWTDHSITRKTKVSIYRVCVSTSWLYSPEIWIVLWRQLQLLKYFHKKYLRQKLKMKWQSMIPDTEILSMVEYLSIDPLFWGDTTSAICRKVCKFLSNLKRPMGVQKTLSKYYIE